MNYCIDCKHYYYTDRCRRNVPDTIKNPTEEMLLVAGKERSNDGECGLNGTFFQSWRKK